MPMVEVIFPRLLSPFAAQVGQLAQQFAAFERAPPAQQAQLRDRQLSAMVMHAKRACPYWRERLAPFTGQFNFADLPVLTRSDLQTHAAALVAEPGTALPHTTHMVVAQTSGSTGTPVSVTKGLPLFNLLYQAQYLRLHAWHALDATQDLLVVKDLPEGVQAGGWGQTLSEAGPTGRAWSKNLVAHDAEEIWEWVLTQPAPYLFTSPSMALRLAEIARADSRRRHLQAVVTFGEVVRAEHRAAVAAAFGARLIDRYSSEEMGWLAFQCPRHDHYHALSGTAHLEIVDEDNRPVAAGETGRVLVTALHQYAMPIIRYDIGDHAVAGQPCDCGIHLPVIQEILGRERSFIRLPNGTTRLARLTGEYWRSIAPVREYRLVQYADGEIEAFVTTERSLLAAEIHALENMLLSRLHPDLKVRITPVAHIDWDARWKRLDVLRVDRLRGDAL
jgi:phenylacetate-CoA ligase